MSTVRSYCVFMVIGIVEINFTVFHKRHNGVVILNTFLARSMSKFKSRQSFRLFRPGMHDKPMRPEPNPKKRSVRSQGIKSILYGLSAEVVAFAFGGVILNMQLIPIIRIGIEK